ncbi:MAG: hypothetical protein BroJett040_11380 [Oligoflexia bacterium]|nr:MAG: hypothetical protein BroJett040_11380 [Oligoflexia bacterium]
MNSKTEQTQGGKGPKEVIHQDEEMRCQVQFKESESRREIGAKANLMRIQCGLSEEEVLALIK